MGGTRPAFVGAGRYPDKFGKPGAEGPQGRTTDGEAYVCDGHIGLPQERHCPFYPPGHQVTVGRLAVGAAKLPAEVAGGHVDATGQGFNIERLRILPVNPVPDPPKQRKVAKALGISRIGGHLRDIATPDVRCPVPPGTCPSVLKHHLKCGFVFSGIVIRHRLAKNEAMTVHLRSLETAVPTTVLIQHEARDVFAAQPGLTRLGSRLVATCFDSAAIDTRYTAVRELSLDYRTDDPQFFDPSTGLLLNPSTKVRNDIFATEATALFNEAARSAVDSCKGIGPEDITHLITVSCTGFFNPGPDYKIVRELGLNPSVQRFHLGFMGCYAAFPALRAAKHFCDADPEAVVLVVCAELCSLHVRTSNDPDTIMGSALFADGAAAAVVSARDLGGEPPLMRIDQMETVLTPVGEESMAWNIGDHGFEMILGNYVPHIIEEHITGALEPYFGVSGPLSGVQYQDLPHWAIHPGGRSILDKVQHRLELSDEQLVPAREVLRNYGNMSSSTVLFVMRHILDQPGGEGEGICSMAFGPGLTVETGLFTKLRSLTPAREGPSAEAAAAGIGAPGSASARLFSPTAADSST